MQSTAWAFKAKSAIMANVLLMHLNIYKCGSETNMTQSVKGMDVYLTIEPFQGGFLCAAVAVPLLPRFSWSHYL